MNLNCEAGIKHLKVKQKGQGGSILMLALWCLMFLSVLTVIFGTMARQQIILADNIEKRADLYDLASSGPEIIIDTVVSLEGRDIHSERDITNTLISKAPSFSGPVVLEKGMLQWGASPGSVGAGYVERRFGLVDESGKININYAGIETLSRLIAALGINVDKAWNIAGRIIDWRDIDDVVIGGDTSSSERAVYSGDEYGYYPRNKPFVCVEELLLVYGMTPRIFVAIRDHVTVFGTGKVNVNTASIPVLQALGLSPEIAQKLVFIREQKDMEYGVNSRNTFRDLGEMVSALEHMGEGLSEEQERQLDNFILSGYAGTRAEVFSLLITARLHRGGPNGVLLCTFERNGRILYWSYNMYDVEG